MIAASKGLRKAMQVMLELVRKQRETETLDLTGAGSDQQGLAQGYAGDAGAGAQAAGDSDAVPKRYEVRPGMHGQLHVHAPKFALF